MAYSFVFCFLMYIGVAACGFLMFGNSVKSQFTLSMPKVLVASKIATWTMVGLETYIQIYVYEIKYVQRKNSKFEVFV